MIRAAALFVPAVLAVAFVPAMLLRFPTLPDTQAESRRHPPTAASYSSEREPGARPTSAIPVWNPPVRSLFHLRKPGTAGDSASPSVKSGVFPDATLVGTLVSGEQPVAYVRSPVSAEILDLKVGSLFAVRWEVTEIEPDRVVFRSRDDDTKQILSLSERTDEKEMIK